MPLGHWNLEFLAHNSQRSYPIAEDADGLDITGDFTLPNSFVLELFLPVHAGLNVDPGQFFLKTLGVYSTGFSVVIGYKPDDGDAVPVASAQISRVAHVPGNIYTLGGLQTGDYDFRDTRGRITIGDLDEIDDQPPGLWQFALENGRLEADAIRPIIRGVSSISIANGNEVSGPYTGHVLLRAGSNYRLDYDEVDGQPRITFNAIEGAGLTEDCVCGDESAGPIMTINGIPPDSAGNFNLLPGSCLEFDTIDHGLLLNDTCSEPCCGCEDLEELTRALEGFGDQANTLDGFMRQLEASVQQMELTVLGSRLGDRSCVEGDT